MKSVYKNPIWIAGSVVLIFIGISGFFIIKKNLHSEFRETKIYFDEDGGAVTDTTINVNGVGIKMILLSGKNFLVYKN